jgi:Multiubiquitin
MQPVNRKDLAMSPDAITQTEPQQLSHKQDDPCFVSDGEKYFSSDPVLSGRQIRAMSTSAVASNVLLILLENGGTRSVGLEENVDLISPAPREFRTFIGDRIFTATLNEKGLEWGGEEVSADDLRHIGDIPDDFELYLDSDGDRVIDDDEGVRLKRAGVERIRSRAAPPRAICIIVNGREMTVSIRRISFADLAVLAYPNPPTGQDVCFTVSFDNGPKKRPEGSLVDGESVRIRKGMVFHVSATDKS